MVVSFKGIFLEVKYPIVPIMSFRSSCSNTLESFCKVVTPNFYLMSALEILNPAKTKSGKCNLSKSLDKFCFDNSKFELQCFQIFDDGRCIDLMMISSFMWQKRSKLDFVVLESKSSRYFF